MGDAVQGGTRADSHGQGGQEGVDIVAGRLMAEESARGVARGQSMVVYRGTRVLGEGTINATAR